MPVVIQAYFANRPDLGMLTEGNEFFNGTRIPGIRTIGMHSNRGKQAGMFISQLDSLPACGEVDAWNQNPVNASS